MFNVKSREVWVGVIVVGLVGFGLMFDRGVQVVRASGEVLDVFMGDVDGDGDVDRVDVVELVAMFGTSDSEADFNGDDKVNALDVNLQEINFGEVMVEPTQPPSPTMSPSPSAMPSPPQTGEGIWLSRDEIKALPIAGQNNCKSGSLCHDAWNSIVNVAQGNWGEPDLSWYAGLEHSQGIYAGALVAVRCEGGKCTGVNDQAIRSKVLQGLGEVVGTEQDALISPNNGELLAPPRQFPRYVIAAELMGVMDWENGYKGADNFVAYMREAEFEYAGAGRQTFAEMHDQAASNGNTMGGFARMVSAAYLNDNDDLDAAWLTFRRFAGDTSVGPDLHINPGGRDWLWVDYDTSKSLGINPLGAKCFEKNYPADGVIPADQQRGGECPTNPDTEPGYTQYPWEGLQGMYAQAELLRRYGYKDPQGKDPYQIQDKALLRAVKYQWDLQQKFGGDWYDKSRAAWVKHLAKLRYGFVTEYNASDGGRNVSYTQWTHPLGN